MKRFALAGNPNCGKTTLFNALTGATEYVGNWPGVTVEKKIGTYKKLKERVEIIDLPGIYSLSPYTPEEVIARNFIIDEKPDAVINIVDATNLERNLYLSTQILEMDVPVVIALNVYDEVEKAGDYIDISKLESALGVRVVKISATKETGLSELMEAALESANNERCAKTVINNPKINSVVNKLKEEFQKMDISSPLFHAIKLAESDEIEAKDHQELVKIVEEYKKNNKDEIFGDDLEAIIADSRYKYISENCSIAYVHSSLEKEDNKITQKLSRSDKIDKVLTNRWAGIPIFLVILFLIFHLTFSENLFWLGKLLNLSPSFEDTMFEGLFWSDSGINSPGVILYNFLDNLTGAFSDLVASWMENAPGWLSGFVVDGIFKGIFSVLSFVPQILLLFLFFSILEDSGYMARVAFILDRIFRRFGLSGRAFMPMIMGFGCSVPAMINTRTLSTDNERVATIRVIPFFSCGAKQPILIAISAGICNVFGFSNSDIIIYLMYLTGIITAIITIILMRNTTMRGKVPPFIMELPTYHSPKAKSLFIHMWDKLKHYVKKAFTIILASTIIIWFLESFTWRFKYIEQASPIDITKEVFEAKFSEELSEGEITINKGALIALNDEYIDEKGDVTVSFSDIYSAYLELLDEGSNAELILAYEQYTNNILSEANDNYHEIVNDEDYKDATNSILAGVGKGITWFFTPLGFGSQLNKNGWIFPVSAFTGLIAKENVIATFAVLAQGTTTKATNINEFKEIYEINLKAGEGSAAASQMIRNTGASWQALIAYIVFNMTTIPCFAAVATAKAELVSSKDDKEGKKKFWFTVLFWLVTSYIVSTIIYLVLKYVWPLAIVLVLSVLVIYLIHRYNKSHLDDAPEVLEQ